MTSPRPTTRQKKSARQRAEEQLGIAQRRVDAITKKLGQAKTGVQTLEFELAKAEQRLEYTERNPDLPQQPTTGTTKETP